MQLVQWNPFREMDEMLRTFRLPREAAGTLRQNVDRSAARLRWSRRVFFWGPEPGPLQAANRSLRAGGSGTLAASDEYER